MPTYDFKCLTCGHIVTQTYSNWRDAIASGPQHCGAPMEKQMAAPAFAVNGYSAKNGYTK